uniref:DUF3452 domain-containing protein n=1 Tax=Ascaris lumbricoides TaxID=6252 RepID=A0A0M3HIM5_ASCLU
MLECRGSHSDISRTLGATSFSYFEHQLPFMGILCRNVCVLQWYETLCVWLEAPGVVMEEVAMWYNEWKGRFPIEISSLHVVREQLMRALLAMNEAQQGMRVNRQPAPPPPPVPPMPLIPGAPLPPRPPPPSLSHLSFKVSFSSLSEYFNFQHILHDFILVFFCKCVLAECICLMYLSVWLFFNFNSKIIRSRVISFDDSSAPRRLTSMKIFVLAL